VGGVDRLDHVRREGGLSGRVVDRVRAQQRERQLRLELPQQRDAVVELVVAQGRGVISDRVHRRGHRVDAAGSDRLDLGVVVRQGSALDRVARIDEERAGSSSVLTDLVDQRGDLRETEVVLGLVVVLGILEVVPVEGVAVQVRRAHDREVVVVLLPVASISHCRGSGHGDERHGRCQDSEPPDAARDGDAHAGILRRSQGAHRNPCGSMLGPFAPDGNMSGSSGSLFSSGSLARRRSGPGIGWTGAPTGGGAPRGARAGRCRRTSP
jgi:hypothetical protein